MMPIDRRHIAAKSLALHGSAPAAGVAQKKRYRRQHTEIKIGTSSHAPGPAYASSQGDGGVFGK